MRIGFSSIYSWRPHVEHLHYLAMLAQRDGHEIYHLTCDSDFASCYTKELRPDRSAFFNCARCRVGGVRSYASANVSSIGNLQVGDLPDFDTARLWALSSASTLGRFESDEDYLSPEFSEIADRLAGAAQKAYRAACNWISNNKLEAICVFNGRMDATRALLEAARHSGIRCITVERTWFGDGLQLIPDDNCLGLRQIDRMMSLWRERPLTSQQSYVAASHVASRFLRRNAKEWRAYNISAKSTEWPVTNGRSKILFTPGSRNEVWGHDDWREQWPNRTSVLDAIMAHFDLRPSDVVLRCHPNWGEKIGLRTGAMAERYYTEWARARGVHCIASTDTTSTLGLIEQSDAIVVCGGSAALEASILGKQVIATTPSVYQEAGFQSDATSPSRLASLSLNARLPPVKRALIADSIARCSLRFCYAMTHRVPQYTRFVKCVTTTRYRYFDGASASRLMSMIRTGEIEADDQAYAETTAAEDAVLEMIRNRRWDRLMQSQEPGEMIPLPVQRRLLFRPIDRIREAMPRGDL